jgi:hypothetical protein
MTHSEHTEMTLSITKPTPAVKMARQLIDIRLAELNASLRDQINTALHENPELLLDAKVQLSRPPHSGLKWRAVTGHWGNSLASLYFHRLFNGER